MTGIEGRPPTLGQDVVRSKRNGEESQIQWARLLLLASSHSLFVVADRDLAELIGGDDCNRV